MRWFLCQLFVSYFYISFNKHCYYCYMWKGHLYGTTILLVTCPLIVTCWANVELACQWNWKHAHEQLYICSEKERTTENKIQNVFRSNLGGNLKFALSLNSQTVLIRPSGKGRQSEGKKMVKQALRFHGSISKECRPERCNALYSGRREPMIRRKFHQGK
jgi:hypothetical protein